MLYQVGALSAIAKAEGAALRHVKPHGALYNMSVRRADIAEAIARAVASFDADLVLVGLPGSELLSAGSRLGLRVAAEAFADRSYEPDGSLTPRHLARRVLSEPGRAAERAVRMVRDGQVVARDGSTLSIKVDTICVHGDTPGAAEIAAAVRAGLEEAGVLLLHCEIGRLADCSTVDDSQSSNLPIFDPDLASRFRLLCSRPTARRSTFPAIVFGSDSLNST